MELFMLVTFVVLVSSIVVIHVTKADVSVVDLVDKIRRLGRRLK